jgi:hypothetical protein
MATVTDTLETVLRLTQLNTFLAGFQLITQAVGAAEEAFVGYEASVLRTQFFLEQFGHSLPTQQIADFTRAISLQTGETQSAIASLEGYLARFKASGADIERATQVIINASQATGVPIEQLGHLIERARAGHARGLWDELGIQVKSMEGQLYSLNQIIDIVDQHTHGFADQFGTTLPGEIKKTTAAFNDMLISLGALLSPAILATAHALQVIFEGIAEAAREVAGAFGVTLPDLAGAAGAAAAGSGTSKTEDYLEQIVHNTGPQGPLGRALLGGGSFNQPGGGLHIRDFNMQFRTGTGTR